MARLMNKERKMAKKRGELRKTRVKVDITTMLQLVY